jgi:hypothetical protein
MECIIVSDVDRDDVFAELYHEGEQWAEVQYDRKRREFLITVFPQTSGEPIHLRLTEMEEALEYAKQRLYPRIET